MQVLRVGKRSCLAWVAVLLTCGVVTAQEDESPNGFEQAGAALRMAFEQAMIPPARLTDGPKVRAAFEAAVADATQATVRIRVDGHDVALGGIVGTDGWIVTKSSSIEGQPTCRLADGREFDVQLVGYDREYDLAVLKIAAKNLPVLKLKRDTDGDVGEWVATVSTDKTPIAVGVISVDTRTIAHQPGVLGVMLEEGGDDVPGARVVRVYPDSGAAEAGIRVNDVIVAIDDFETPNRLQTQEAIRKFSPGEEITVKLLRDGQTVTLSAMLGGLPKDVPQSRRDFQNSLGGDLSPRRYGFPAALQHSTVLRPSDCGGPLVDLEGRVVGFNIARSGRTESFAIPSNVVVTRLFDLMSGNLAPKPAPAADAETQPVSDDDPEQPAETAAPAENN